MKMWLLFCLLLANSGGLFGVHVKNTGNRIVVTTPLANDSSTGEGFPRNQCPAACTCNLDTYSISCSGDIKDFTFKNISPLWKLKDLTLYGGLLKVPDELQNHTEITVLNLSGNKIKSFDKSVFEKNSHLRYLDLSENEISEINTDAFDELNQLTFLNLSGNNVKQLPQKPFLQRTKVEILDLSKNSITQISNVTFFNLPYLKVLDLSFNKLEHIQELFVSNMSLFKNLYLRHNKISSISSEMYDRIESLNVLDMSENPWDCSCALYPLLELWNYTSLHLANNERYFCMVPKKYSGLNVFSLNKETLPCSSPIISHISDSQHVSYLTEAHLTCTVTGDPEPFIYWITPWGKVFTQEKNYHLLQGKNFTLKSQTSYFGIPFTTTNVYVSTQNSLFVQNFRGYFDGEYVCVGVNLMGEANATVYLHIHSSIYDIYLMSNFIGGASAGGMLALAIFAGLMKMCTKAVCKCTYCDEDDEELDKDKFEEKSEENSSSDSPTSTLDRETDYYDEDFTPTTPLNSPCGRTPRASPTKCVTPTESPDKWRNSTILDTLDEVKFRLQRRMDKVRGHVRGQVGAIRTSGSQYIQTIKDTGSSAYGRVRAGMVIGVEQVKYGYQSIREFCGTGEMGNQTISMISVSTDVDTQEQSRVVKSVTMV